MQNFQIRGDTLLDKVYDNLTGKLVRAESLTLDNDEGLELRERIQKYLHRDEPLFKCPICHKAVKLRSSIDKSGQYFIHETIEGNCPYLEAKGLSQAEIRAKNYAGKKESPAHKETKAWLEECLKADPAFSDVIVERRFTCTKGSKTYRVPDVRATLHRPEGDLVIAFEIQLSSTFLTEIVGRREFYLDQGALLVWVSRNFEIDAPKMTQHDVVAPNNMNAFVVDKSTHAKSMAERKLHMTCHWVQPVIAEDGISLSKTFHSRMIDFHELKLNQELQHAFLYDYKRNKEALKQKIAYQAERRVVDNYLEWCALTNPASNEAVKAFVHLCQEKSIKLPKSEGKLVSVTQHLLSAKAGIPRGHRFNKLIECAHKIYTDHSHFFFYFRSTYMYYGWDNLLKEQDKHRNRPWETIGWEGKVKQAWNRMKEAGSIKEFHDDSFRELILFMFPEIESTLDQRMSATLRRLK